ncbi:MAG: bifunctional 4-hydroxy-2-oxoglutarate aldolase/2-dehydro-3-deoxy-phosphogluconate aldolase [Elusimicrobiota bacterium]|jgi:2-dehydro-3-deoxyphosphogluconate aldolase/(4S)-4-hydroxy-2-oxoglutarate aldolase|nr:bifunctional 4-hydroxy-2-oxoglutarate aldolase/2-dehydro-3-deoxy-phosphogluconate aldolase [Elusimicrobiota bacterium]
MKYEELAVELAKKGVIAVLEIEKTEDAALVSKALLDGGISAIELALRTDAAEPSISIIAKETPQMTIGIGTIIKKGQAKRVQGLGASFGLAPGLNKEIVREAKEAGLPFIPGIATPSEIEEALSEGLNILKFFPAQPLGGLEYLKSMNNPYNYLGLKYVPLGGVNESNLADYASMPQIVAIGGTWIAPRALIKEKNWNEITQRAEKALGIWRKAKNG